jgi:hypothetical protein
MPYSVEFRYTLHGAASEQQAAGKQDGGEEEDGSLFPGKGGEQRDDKNGVNGDGSCHHADPRVYHVSDLLPYPTWASGWVSLELLIRIPVSTASVGTAMASAVWMVASAI